MTDTGHSLIRPVGRQNLQVIGCGLVSPVPLALTQGLLYLLRFRVRYGVGGLCAACADTESTLFVVAFFSEPGDCVSVSSQLVPPSAPCLTLPLHADNLGYSARDLQFYVGSEPREQKGFSGRI